MWNSILIHYQPRIRVGCVCDIFLVDTITISTQKGQFGLYRVLSG